MIPSPGTDRQRYGPVVAVDGLSFDVTPGKITGFPGPNGAGGSRDLENDIYSQGSPGGAASSATTMAPLVSTDIELTISFY